MTRLKITYCPPASAKGAELQEYQFWFPTYTGYLSDGSGNRNMPCGVVPELAALKRLRAKQRKLRAPREATA